jgi:hypothetical protein
VIIDVVVTRFHAMTFEAELSNNDWGVHNIIKFAAPGRRCPPDPGEVLVKEARRTPDPGRTLAGLAPTTGHLQPAMRAARCKGQSQKSMITASGTCREDRGGVLAGPWPRHVAARFSRQGN